MIDWSWITTTASATLMTVLSAIGIYFGIILFTRLAGLRSFSKMSGFDFITTVAFGAILASGILLQNVPMVRALVALGSLFILQKLVSATRMRIAWVSKLVDNKPLLLMDGPTMLRDNMRKAHVTESDLWAKLREANVLDLSQVHAVVMETTGTINVLHGSPDGMPLHPDLLTDVALPTRTAEDVAGTPS